jgi:hypothetical protein
MQKHREMIEISRPFAGAGFRPAVAGVLKEITTVNVGGRNRTQYTFRRRDGSLFAFLAECDLDRIIRPAHIGEWLVVKLDAFYSRPKFSVWSSKEKKWLSASSSNDAWKAL